MKTPIDMIMDGIEWRPITGVLRDDSGSFLPSATHEGILRIMDFEFKCYQLSDGRRVINGDDVINFFELNLRPQ
jgi:hypothetical protein